MASLSALRINAGGKYRLPHSSVWQPLATLAPQAGAAWAGSVVCFKSQPLSCTLLASHTAPHSEAWLVLTDLAPDQADVCWYALRPWIECGFKDTKRGGWQWQHTQISDPARATRHWLAIAIATLWVVSVGGEADATLPVSTLTDLPATHIARRRPTKRSRPRLLSCFRRGWLVLIGQLIRGQAVALGRFYPEPWPSAQPTSAAP